MNGKFLWLFGLFVPLASFDLSALSGATPSGDVREAVVDAFMSARTLPDNVEARKLMTADLEQKYLRNKKLSVRVRSGRVVAFDYDPAGIRVSGDKEFQLEVRSLWADLNEQVFATQLERLGFVKVRNDWLADKIDFLKSVPPEGLRPLKLEEQKRAKGALVTAKKFAKALVNRNPQQAELCVTQEFRNQSRSPEAWAARIAGPSAPVYAAYDVRDLSSAGRDPFVVKIGLYSAEKGRRGMKVIEARLELREGRTNWNVNSFELLP